MITSEIGSSLPILADQAQLAGDKIVGEQSFSAAVSRAMQTLGGNPAFDTTPKPAESCSTMRA
jgi:hypothetical protein